MGMLEGSRKDGIFEPNLGGRVSQILKWTPYPSCRLIIPYAKVYMMAWGPHIVHES